MDKWATRARVDVHVVTAKRQDEVDTALARIETLQADALLVVPTSAIATAHRTVLAFTFKRRLPAMSTVKWLTEAGGLMSYSVDDQALDRRAAVYVDRILKGAKPADLPMEQPTKFELVINLKTAKALGLTIPPSLLLRADQVIE
jgi:putative ABC transport system substrate-binding protein